MRQSRYTRQHGKASYTFTATEDGTYIIRFEGSNCTLDSYSDGKEIELKRMRSIHSQYRITHGTRQASIS